MSRADIQRLGRIAEDAYFAEDSTSPETFRRTARAILTALRDDYTIGSAESPIRGLDRVSELWRGMLDHLLAD